MQTDLPEPLHEHHVHHRHFERLVMLSDGVFAIAMTLSAVELRPEAQLGQTLAQIWLKPLLTYFISFFIISGVWLRHRRTLAHLRRVDTPMTLISLLLLSLVALMPVVIRQMLDGSGSWNAIGMLIYSVSLATIYASLGAGWGYAAFIAELAPDVSQPRAWGWLLEDLFVAALFGALAFYSRHWMPATAVFALAAVSLRAGSLWLLKKAKDDQPGAPLAGNNPGQ